jgi:two-component system, cell cycle sensor histidine kinase and response regulator CckA
VGRRSVHNPNKAQAETQLSLARPAWIVESSDDAIIGKDLSGRITSWNRGAERIYGYKAEEMIGKSIAAIVPGNRADDIDEILRRVTCGERIDHYEAVRVHKSGALLDVSLTLSPVYDSAGAIVGASIIARDITVAKRAEIALRESEAQYRILFDRNPLPMWVFDRKSLRFLAVNEAAVRHYGYGRNEFFNMTILDIWPLDDIAPLLRSMKHPSPGFQQRERWRHRKKDGTIIDVEITGHDLNFRGADAELVLAHDTTEELRGEEQLRQSEERFSKAFRSSPVGITISSEADGRYIDANPAYLAMMGYERDELVGQTVEELGVWAEKFDRQLMIEQLKHPPAKPIEVSFKTRSREIRLVELVAERILLNDEPCILAIVRDITGAKQLERQFRHAQKMEAIGQLAGGVAHDFNNILGVITGYAELSLQKLEPQHAVARNLQKIKTAADRATSLTKQLLAFSRQQVVHPHAVDVNAIVRNMDDMLRSLIGEDISITVNEAALLGSINADIGQLEQVLMNLVVNARDAMPGGGRITIETRNVELDESYQRKHEPVQPGQYVMLSVADSGCGMDETTVARIFEPFFTTKEAGRGTGLGLSTVYGIVKQSGGYIWVYSEPGKGTTFKLYFPRVSEAPEAFSKPIEYAVPEVGSATILLVEDDQDLRELTATTLRNAGYAVLEASNSQTALELGAKHPGYIDLLLSDIVMPGTSGVQLIPLLRESAPDLKVILMSGYATETLARHAPAPPDVTLIEKPFSKRFLLSTIQKVVQKRRRD